MAQASLGYEDYGFKAEQLKQNLANILGNYDGQQTLGARQLAQQAAAAAAQQALARAQMEQQASQWQQSFDSDKAYREQQASQWQQSFDSDKAYREQQAQWQQQQYLGNLLNNYYSQTGKWQFPESVKPADYLEQLFKSAGYR